MIEAESQTVGDEVDYLLSPAAIRERCRSLHSRGLDGHGAFEVHLERMESVASFVAEVTRTAHPQLDIPYHARWRHFQVGGIDRLAQFERELASLDRIEQIRSRIDLVMISVLLDAGAGPRWSYRDSRVVPARSFGRSEGLAVASLDMFLAGQFSSDPEQPLRADAAALARFDTSVLNRGMQVGDDNPLAGSEGRAGLLRALGRSLGDDGPTARPCDLFQDRLQAGLDAASTVPATLLLDRVLRGLSSIWPGRVTLAGQTLGDTWEHPALGPEGSSARLVPFHKLSQWLTYSLLEAFESGGIAIEGIDELTGLAEYRNGGLFVDMGVLVPRESTARSERHSPGSALIVEWRAHTLCLLDELAPAVREQLGRSAAQFPLARVLEGGTWRAGRQVAARLREDGGPPIQIASDGTVF